MFYQNSYLVCFTSIHQLTCHYRLEEFLRRRARLQRVEDEVRRRVVLGFFDMLYYSRKFKRHMEIKRSARMTGIPQLDVPEIMVDNEEDRAAGRSNSYQGGGATSTPLSPGAGDFLSADDAHAHHRSWSNVSADLSSYDTSYGHPLAGPRASGPVSPSHRAQPSGFSFELNETPPDYDPANEDDGGGTRGSIGSAGHRGSAVSPAQVREMLDDSVWMDSIRRSATMNRRGPDA